MSIFDNIKNIFLEEDEDFLEQKVTKKNTDYSKYKAVYATEGEKITIIPWNSKDGRHLMLDSIYINSLFALAHKYQTQINPFYSSVACVVTVLNALRLEKGVVPNENSRSFELFDQKTGDLKEYSFNIYTQESLLDEETDQLIKPRREIIPKIRKGVGYVDFSEFAPGLSLLQVKELLKLYECKAEIYYAHDDIENGVATFIQHLKECCITSNKFIITNFYGEVIGLPTSGHYSVIGAYNGKKYAKALVLDTAAHKTPWYWVEVEQLYRAMNTIAEEGNKRGYIIVEDSFS